MFLPICLSEKKGKQSFLDREGNLPAFLVEFSIKIMEIILFILSEKETFTNGGDGR